MHESPAEIAALQALTGRSYATAGYAPECEEFLDSGPAYARINADRMFTFSMPDG